MGEPKLTFRTVEEFLAWEERQPERYEYAGGVVRLMTGGARGHSVIKVNVVSELDRSSAAGRARRSIPTSRCGCPRTRSDIPTRWWTARRVSAAI